MVTPIIVLSLLLFPLLVAYFTCKWKGVRLDAPKYACFGLGLTFLFFSIGHFARTEGMVEMLPPWVPWRELLIYLTGALEAAIGAALFSPRYSRLAAITAILTLIGFFPANVYAALNGVGLGGHQWGPVYLLIRTPLQIVLVGWAYFLCLRGHNKSMRSTATVSTN